MEGILIIAVMIIATLCLLGWEHNFKQKHGRSAIHWQYVALLIFAVLGMATLNNWMIVAAAVGALITIIYHTPKYGIVSAVCIAVYNLLIIAAVISVINAITNASKRK